MMIKYDVRKKKIPIIYYSDIKHHFMSIKKPIIRVIQAIFYN